MVAFVLQPFRERLGKNREYYKILRQIFGIRPNNIEIYKLALIHRSASFMLDGHTPLNNERLEFLGDSILESIVTDYLFNEFPAGSEGFLTQMRSRLVSRQMLNHLCVEIGLSEHIIANGSMAQMQKHMFGDALEAMIGAIYLDKGYDYTNRLMINHVFRHHVNIHRLSITESDHKSRLIEWGQKSRQFIRFETGYSDESTSHRPDFISRVFIGGEQVGYGRGGTKKEAEQNAAYMVSHLVSDEDEIDALMDNIDHALGEEAL